MKNKTEDAMVETYQKMIDRLKTGGIFLEKHILDNEISEKYKKTIEKNGMKWELVPVGTHRRNIPEKQRKRLKGILIQSYAEYPTIYHSTNGIPCYLRPS